jgi:hypothetical protein
MRRIIKDVFEADVNRPIDVTDLPEDAYFTDDNTNNQYFTDDNTNNMYVWTDE